MIQLGIYEQIRPFVFYTLSEFKYEQLKSRSKRIVSLYRHIQAGFPCVIKQIPFQERHFQIYRTLMRLKSPNIAHVLGMAKKQSPVDPFSSTILLFMEKYDCSLFDFMAARRKKMQPFKKDEINSFMRQMTTILEKMQREGLAHRDIKPENILYSKGVYVLCDFDDSIFREKILAPSPENSPIFSRKKFSLNKSPGEFQVEISQEVDITTIEFCSLSLLKELRSPKGQEFDPFRLDLYALGLTLLQMISSGRFSLQERMECCQGAISDYSSRHEEFLDEQLKKHVRCKPQYASFLPCLQAMLEEDELKRDDFITFLHKLKSMPQLTQAPEDINLDTESRSSAQLKKENVSSLKQSSHLRQGEWKVYSLLNFSALVLFLLLCIF